MKRFKKILAILPEGSPEADVLSWAATIAAAATADQVTVLRCLEPLLPEYPEPETGTPGIAEEREALEKVLAGRFPTVDLQVKVVAAELMPTILHELSGGVYDLVLIPLDDTPHRNLVERLSRKSPVGVLAIPPDCPAPPRHIIVGVDHSDLSGLAINWAEAFGSLAGETPVTLEAVNGYIVPYTSRATVHMDPRMLRDHIERIAQGQLRDFIGETAGDSSQWKQTLVETTLAGRHLAERANAEEAGLIVIGSHGRNAFKIALLGSHTSDVLRNSQRPVLVVKRKNQSLGFLKSLLGLSE